MTKYRSWAGVICVAFVLSPSLATAWMRAPVVDPDLVQSAEMIVVAHVNDGSLVYVTQPGRMADYHVPLIVTEVIKGHTAGQQIPIIIHYGLTPVIGGEINTEQIRLNVRGAYPDYPKDVIEIFDTGNSAKSFDPIAEDIRKDHLWFLRVREIKDQGATGEDKVDTLGIWDPEDIQPLELKPYFQAFLTGDLTKQLKALAVGHSLLATRSKTYLVHLDIETASKEPDLTKRAELLLPFCLYKNDKEYHSTQQEALYDMTFHCGTAGAARLVQTFYDPTYAAMQTRIMNVWEQTKYHESLPIVTKLLETENHHWIHQALTEQGVTSAAQYESKARVQEALLVLNRLADSASKQIIEETQLIWTAPERHLLSGDIPEICDAALRSISEAVDRAEDGVDSRRLEERKKSDLEVTNAKQIALACRLFAFDHGGSYPRELKELVPMYTAYETIFISPLANDPTRPSYQYFGGSEQDPPKKVLLRSLFTTSNGKRTIVYKDGIAERKNDP